MDGNKQNNSIWNLEMVTSSENTYHAFQIGLNTSEKIKQGLIRFYQYNMNACRKLTDVEVLEMRKLHATGNYTLRQLGEIFHISHPTVYKI